MTLYSFRKLDADQEYVVISREPPGVHSTVAEIRNGVFWGAVAVAIFLAALTWLPSPGAGQ